MMFFRSFFSSASIGPAGFLVVIRQVDQQREDPHVGEAQIAQFGGIVGRIADGQVETAAPVSAAASRPAVVMRTRKSE